jgi:hypothetical protein
MDIAGFSKYIGQCPFVGLPSQRPAFDLRPVHVGFVENKAALSQVLLTTSIFPCWCHFTSALKHVSFL